MFLEVERLGDTLGLKFPQITSHIKGYPFEVLIPDDLNIKGAILSVQVKSLDWEARNIEFLCAAPEFVLREVQNKLVTLIK
jgi:mRNA interferase MazF